MGLKMFFFVCAACIVLLRFINNFLSAPLGDWSWGVPQPHQENALLRIVDGEMHQNQSAPGGLCGGHFLRIAPWPLAQSAQFRHGGQSDGDALLADSGHDLSGPVECRRSGLRAAHYPIGTIYSVNGKCDKVWLWTLNPTIECRRSIERKYVRPTYFSLTPSYRFARFTASFAITRSQLAKYVPVSIIYSHFLSSRLNDATLELIEFIIEASISWKLYMFTDFWFILA